MADKTSRGSGGDAQNGQRVAQSDLRRVARCRDQVDAAVKEWRDAIVAAVASGETTRDVAERAGVSHQRVSQIVREDAARRKG